MGIDLQREGKAEGSGLVPTSQKVTQRSLFGGNHPKKVSREVTDSKRLSERGRGQERARVAAEKATQLCLYQGYLPCSREILAKRCSLQRSLQT